jgi:hypothetical protein
MLCSSAELLFTAEPSTGYWAADRPSIRSSKEIFDRLHLL